MNLTQQVKTDIKKFMARKGLSKTTLGLYAFNNPHAISRFLTGKHDMLLGKVDTLYAFFKK